MEKELVKVVVVGLLLADVKEKIQHIDVKECYMKDGFLYVTESDRLTTYNLSYMYSYTETVEELELP